jgi:hypothetical protein
MLMRRIKYPCTRYMRGVNSSALSELDSKKLMVCESTIDRLIVAPPVTRNSQAHESTSMDSASSTAQVQSDPVNSRRTPVDTTNISPINAQQMQKTTFQGHSTRSSILRATRLRVTSFAVAIIMRI